MDPPKPIYRRNAKTFGLNASRSISIPLQPGVLKDTKGQPVTSAETKLLQRIVGTVMYLMLLTRPDIGFAVQWISRHLTKATNTHINAAKNLLRYLASTRTLAIHYGAKEVNIGPSSNLLQLFGYSDSDFAGDMESSKSTYGYLFTLLGGFIYWKCKRASTIALSTVKAETDALAETIREAKWLRYLFTELQAPISGPIAVFGNNQGSISNAHNPNLHARTKHTLLKFHYVREEVSVGTISIKYLDTKSMPADGLTKPLTLPKHQAFLGLLGLKPKA